MYYNNIKSLYLEVSRPSLGMGLGSLESGKIHGVSPNLGKLLQKCLAKGLFCKQKYVDHATFS